MDTIEILHKEHIIEDLYFWQEKIDSFVEAVSDNYYVKNRAANPNKVKKDIWIGKLAEVGVAQYLNKEGYPWLEPDFSIYGKNNKSWDADLPYEGRNIHVKSCDKWTSDYLKKNCGDTYSWTFQWSNANGKGGKDKIFSSNDEVALVYVPEMNSHWIHIVSIISFGIIKPLLKDPINPKLVGIKKCLYYKDMQ